MTEYIMQGLRKVFNRPRIDDWAPLSQFFYADEKLNAISAELDSFDNRREPQRCTQLVNKLRQAQDRLLHIIEDMIATCFPNQADRAPRDYRVKFPDDIVHDNLPGQLWFGAECLAAGSNIIDHEFESEAIRPLARALVRHIDRLRDKLRDQAVKNPIVYPEPLRRDLQSFDYLFAEFELNYVSAMVPVKSILEYESLQELTVLFMETLNMSIETGLITRDAVDYCDPSIMFALPRLAIVAGLVVFPDGPLNVDRMTDKMSPIFRTYHALLKKIRDLLRQLTDDELNQLERCLCNNEEPVLEKCSYSQPIEARRRSNSTTGTNSSEYHSEIHEHSPESLRQTFGSDSVKLAVPEECATSRSNSGDSSPTVSKDELKETKMQSTTRHRCKSAQDIIHRLFVCISGVADQMQVNYPSDARSILKIVLQPSIFVPDVRELTGAASRQQAPGEETAQEARETPEDSPIRVRPPVGTLTPGVVRWVPDSEAPYCSACAFQFTFMRRRHHCRNCGRVFCSACSNNFISIPELGYENKVRVCNQCTLYRVNPFESTHAPSRPQSDNSELVDTDILPTTSTLN